MISCAFRSRFPSARQTSAWNMIMKDKSDRRHMRFDKRQIDDDQPRLSTPLGCGLGMRGTGVAMGDVQGEVSSVRNNKYKLILPLDGLHNTVYNANAQLTQVNINLFALPLLLSSFVRHRRHPSASTLLSRPLPCPTPPQRQSTRMLHHTASPHPVGSASMLVSPFCRLVLSPLC